MRLEMVETGPRRVFTLAEKRRIVAESMSGPRVVSATARKYNINRSLLFVFASAQEPSGDHDEAAPPNSPPSFLPLMIASPASAPPAIELETPGGVRVKIMQAASPALATAVLQALAKR